MNLHRRQNIVEGSIAPNFIKVAVDELLIYKTPKNIVDHIESERIKAIISNPPFDIPEYKHPLINKK